MFKQMIAAVVFMLMTTFSYGQTSYAVGLATGVPVGTYGAAGAAANYAMMAAAEEEAVSKMTPQELEQYKQSSKKASQFMVYLLELMLLWFVVMAFLIEPGLTVMLSVVGALLYVFV